MIIIAAKCSAIVLKSPYHFIEKKFRIPEIREDELLLKVELVSICGSDRHLYDGTHSASSFPKILGHEVVGFVEKLGTKAAKSCGVKRGDRVTVEPYIMCANCEYCLTGHYQAHQPRMTYGTSLTCDKYPYLWGGYSQYMFIAPGSKLHKIDEDVPPEAACLSSVIGNGVRWVRTKGQVQFGESVVIVGAGAQGLASTLVAKESGASPVVVLGTSSDLYNFSVAKEFGADYEINIDLSDPIKEVAKATNDRMADVVIECAGTPSSVNLSFQLPRPVGRVVLVGLTGNQRVNLNTDRIVNDELTVKGGHGQSWDVEDAIKLINSKKYPIEKMITHKFSLKEAEKAMELFLKPPEDCIRIALIP